MSETKTLVDACVLLDMLGDDPKWGDWSSERIADAIDVGGIVINPLVYAEVSVRFATEADLDGALPDTVYLREALPYGAAFAAGRAYMRYKKAAKGDAKRSPMPDFYIGAHAELNGYKLLTRDANRYRTYFPSVTLITP